MSGTHMIETQIDHNGIAWPFQSSIMAYISPYSATAIRPDSSTLGHMEPWSGHITENRYIPQASMIAQLPDYDRPVSAVGNEESTGHQATQGCPDPIVFMDNPFLHGLHDVARYQHPVAPGAADVLQLTHPDPRQWIIPHTVYAGGPPPDTPVPPAILSISVGDILDLGRLARLKAMDMYHVAAFPDPEGHREKKKFTVRFTFKGLPVNEDPPQVQEYRKPEGSPKRVPLSLIDFAVAVVKQLRKFLCDKQLLFRGRAVDIGHLVIVQMCRPSKGSVQPIFMIHPHFWPFYA